MANKRFLVQDKSGYQGSCSMEEYSTGKQLSLSTLGAYGELHGVTMSGELLDEFYSWLKSWMETEPEEDLIPVEDQTE